MFTNPGSRADLLLTLGRLSVPDVLRHAGQQPAAAVGIGLLCLVFSAVATWILLPLLFGIEDPELRRNVLNLSACITVLFWILAQVVLRVPVTWLLDVERLLPLPAGYRDLYLLRLVLSLVGYWLVGFSPAAVYLLAAQSGGPTHFVLASAAVLTMVLLLGRVAAILTILIDRVIEGLVGPVVVLLATGAAVYSGGIAIGVLDGETEIEAIIDPIRESAILSAAELTPPGLVVALLESPTALADNVLRLGALLLLLAAVIPFERRLLLRQCLSRPGGDRRTAAPTVPLALLLRRVDRLPPSVCLTLAEIECALRGKGVRLCYVISLGYATYATVDVYLGIVAAVLLTAVFLNSVRTEKPPAGSLVWRESLALPLTVFRIFRVPATVTSLLAAPVAALAAAVGIAQVGWNGWQPAVLGAALAAALLLLADSSFSLVQLYRPRRNTDGASEVDPESLAASSLVTLPIMVFLGLCVVLWRIAEEVEGGRLIAAVSTFALCLVAALVWSAATRRQRREIESRARELLLRDQ